MHKVPARMHDAAASTTCRRVLSEHQLPCMRAAACTPAGVCEPVAAGVCGCPDLMRPAGGHAVVPPTRALRRPPCPTATWAHFLARCGVANRAEPCRHKRRPGTRGSTPGPPPASLAVLPAGRPAEGQPSRNARCPVVSWTCLGREACPSLRCLPARRSLWRNALIIGTLFNDYRRGPKSVQHPSPEFSVNWGI